MAKIVASLSLRLAFAEQISLPSELQEKRWIELAIPREHEAVRYAFHARFRAYHPLMTNSGSRQRHFASDNYAGICPEALALMMEANLGHQVSYGDDFWTDKAANLLRQVFETDCEVFFVFNGTSANSLSLASLCQSYHSILCHEMAHVEGSECGAPEFFANGTKVLLLPGANGKIDPKAIEKAVNKRTDIHYPKPRALSLTQATEVGTVYSLDELKELAEVARHFQLRIQMDGARFANAVVSLGVTPKELTWQAGVDVLCFGGTKNGLAVGEAVVFFNPELAREFDYRCKQGGQLASKMRFLSAPWVGMLQDGAWLKHAKHSNAMAKRLEAAIRPLKKVQISYSVDSNAVFAKIPEPTVEKMHERGWKFYTHVGGWDDSRLMCSWDTTPDDVDQFAADLKELAGV
jgi:threonine aldolase